MSARIPMTFCHSLQATSWLERLEDHLPLRHLTTSKPTTQEMVAPCAAASRTVLEMLEKGVPAQP